MDFITHLKNTLKQHANEAYAVQMTSYLRGKFAFYGLKTKPRRELLKILVAEYTDEINENISNITLTLLQQPQRELHHCGIELFAKHKRKSYQEADIELIETLITTNSWWDTVDFISKQILGVYLTQFPEAIEIVIDKFSASNNMWLNRSTLLFQLGYKNKTDQNILFAQYFVVFAAIRSKLKTQQQKLIKSMQLIKIVKLFILKI